MIFPTIVGVFFGIAIGVYLVKKFLIENLMIATAYRDGFFVYKDKRYKVVAIDNKKSYDSLNRVNVV